MEQLLVTGRPYWSFYYKILDDYIQDVADKRKVVLVGHSLGIILQLIVLISTGGGIAKIVGVRKNLTAIAFNSPGVVYSRMKLGLELDKINK
jgi:putative lipase involved disintegration of autophagic bodies